MAQSFFEKLRIHAHFYMCVLLHSRTLWTSMIGSLSVMWRTNTCVKFTQKNHCMDVCLNLSGIFNFSVLFILFSKSEDCDLLQDFYLPVGQTDYYYMVYHLCHSWICCFVLLCVMFSVIILFLNRGLLYHVCCSNVHNLLLSLFKAISRVTWLGRKKTALTAKWFHMAWMVI